MVWAAQHGILQTRGSNLAHCTHRVSPTAGHWPKQARQEHSPPCTTCTFHKFHKCRECCHPRKVKWPTKPSWRCSKSLTRTALVPWPAGFGILLGLSSETLQTALIAVCETKSHEVMNELAQDFFQDLSSSKPATVARVVGKGVSQNSLDFLFFSSFARDGCKWWVRSLWSCFVSSPVHDISDSSRCIQFAIPISVAVPGDISRAELGQVHPKQRVVGNSKAGGKEPKAGSCQRKFSWETS